MFRTVPLSIIRSFSLYAQQWYMLYRFADSLRAGSGRIRPDPVDHVEFYSKNKFEKLVHLVGFIIRIYHDARSSERHILQLHLCQGYGLRKAHFADRIFSWFGGVGLASSRAVPTLTHDAAVFLPHPAYLIVIVSGTCVYCFVDMMFLSIQLYAFRIRTQEP